MKPFPLSYRSSQAPQGAQKSRTGNPQRQHQSKVWWESKTFFTDTDSLMYEIETEVFYQDISPDVEGMFDTTNYLKEHLHE